MNNNQLLERLCAAANAVNRTAKYVRSSNAVVAYFSNMCDPDRVCHNMSSVGRYLQVLDACAPVLDSKHHVEIALFLLDSGQGAGYADRRHGALSNIRDFAFGLDSILIRKMITAANHTHPWMQFEGDHAVVADISLEYLGSNSGDFQSHLELVQGEYAKMGVPGLAESDREFYLKLYRHRLQGRRIYRTEVFHQAFDFMAFINLREMFGDVE